MRNSEVEQQQIKMQKRLNEMLSGKRMMEEDYKIVAVGYLSIDEPFEKGEVSQNFLNKLRILWNEGGIVASAGYHTCEFCGVAKGSSEKTLIDRENKIKYIFPEMIFHYCIEHKFKPSNEFIELVMRSN